MLNVQHNVMTDWTASHVAPYLTKLRKFTVRECACLSRDGLLKILSAAEELEVFTLHSSGKTEIVTISPVSRARVRPMLMTGSSV